MAKKRIKLSLPLKFIILISFLILMTSLVLSLFFIRRESRALTTSLIKRAESLVRNLAYNSEFGVLTTSEDILAQLIKGVINEEDIIYCFIRDTSGNILSELKNVPSINFPENVKVSDNGDDKSESRIKVDENIDSIAGNVKANNVHHQLIKDKESGLSFYDLAIPVTTVKYERTKREISLFDAENPFLEDEKRGEIKTIGFAHLGVSLKRVNEEIGRVSINVLLLTFGVVFAGILITVLLVRMISRPLNQLTVVTQRVARGDLTQQVDIKTGDEIGELAGFFNRMVVDLKKSRDDIEEYSRTLEQKVEERTTQLEETNLFLQESLDKLKELDQLKSQFFANISHELRTPITMVLAPLQSMLQGELGGISESQKQYFESMHNNSLRLLKLINNLLDFSKLEVGRMRLRIEHQDIAEVVRYLLGSLSSWADRRRIDITYEIAKDIPKIYFDREKIEKVLLNLLSNSIKFTDKGGLIKLSVSDKNGRVRVSVSDTGKGIPKESQEKIFERFAQVDGTASREYEGSGIGLSLARELIELHGGTIWVESEINKGSTFTFELLKGKDHFKEDVLEAIDEGEIVSDDERSEETGKLLDSVSLQLSDISTTEEEGIGGERGASKEHSVLVIEDNPDLRKFLNDLLKDSYNVIFASDGVEGMNKVRRETPDLVISDVMMPRKSGYEVCQEIKHEKDLRHIPVILLTAKVDIAMKIEGLEYGADDYLTKPFNSKELLVRVRNLLELRKIENELANLNRTLEDKVRDQVKEIQKKSKLERYISPQLAKSIISEEEEIHLSSSRKKLTIFFSDIRGFTELSDSMEPEETIDILNQYLSEMTKIVFEYGGTLDKFMGDGIMVFFGDPIKQEDHTQRAVKMAIKMQERLKELQPKWFTGGDNPLSIGIGINTGYITVGNIGSETHMDYTVVGNQVNLAARLERMARPGEILISQATYREVRDIVEVEERGDKEIKGFSRPVIVYNVKGLV